ncbi:hypothetical protein CcCBS67573_g08050 [Chytriomyces confervae]|uniref:Transmembrane protein 14 n=1 Tax=Chytriomyces confervae TaxID=246404 RepID=A0A507EPA9_9FUNG|nr:hypothetical protein CcCBS67573_g08050 [Chytriomyces confervae]
MSRTARRRSKTGMRHIKKNARAAFRKNLSGKVLDFVKAEQTKLKETAATATIPPPPAFPSTCVAVKPTEQDVRPPNLVAKLFERNVPEEVNIPKYLPKECPMDQNTRVENAWRRSIGLVMMAAQLSDSRQDLPVNRTRTPSELAYISLFPEMMEMMRWSEQPLGVRQAALDAKVAAGQPKIAAENVAAKQETTGTEKRKSGIENFREWRGNVSGFFRGIVSPELPAYVLGSICAAGGTMGFIKGKSVPSLVAGLTCAGLYAIAGSRVAASKPYGAEIAVSVSLLLLAMMGKKAITKKAPVAIVMSGVGLIGAIFYLNQLLSASGRVKKI